MSGLELHDIKRSDEKASGTGLTEPASGVPMGNLEIAFVGESLRPPPTDSAPPDDRYRLVFFILLTHGIGSLMPWNMFITANDYFVHYKLAGDDRNLEHLRKNFLSYLGVASQVPNVIFNGLNLLFNIGSGNLKFRVNVTLAVEAVIFVLTIVLAVLDSSQWPEAFFYTTMTSVVVINMASGIYQNCIFGTGAKFPSAYTNAILIGNNLSGTFTAIVSILSIWLAPKTQEAAVYYFLAALLVIVFCLITYNLLPTVKFYRYYNRLADLNGLPAYLTNDENDPNGIFSERARRRINGDPDEEQSADDDSTGGIDILRETVDAMVPRPSKSDEANARAGVSTFIAELYLKWDVFKKCWTQCLNVFFCFFVTLILFPSVLSNVSQSQPGGFVSPKYFNPVTCFLVFNAFAMFGNLISGWTTWPGKDRVWIFVMARFLFIPFFLYCNFNPTSRKWPVLITSDIVYTVGNMFLALTSGYVSSLCMMFASRDLKPDEAPKGGMIAAFFLIAGIFVGISSSFVLTNLVEL